jgi:hypothetical protein
MRMTRQRARGRRQHGWEEKQKKRNHDVLRKEVNLGLETRKLGESVSGLETDPIKPEIL